MALYEALYKRKCRSLVGWFEVEEAELLGPNIVEQDMKRYSLLQDDAARRKLPPLATMPMVGPATVDIEDTSFAPSVE
ncbi:hypothetical protein MTR67_039432 [Solanum verrucosum]|uniref:Uncharacterized protein n=1 Tax=Solanum verrucosum TaxID=315347 RepID=A0AAF0UHD2_SOLVR|nr:hypothetical protein MTR67_039432 [Solanum verrucosum]